MSGASEIIKHAPNQAARRLEQLEADHAAQQDRIDRLEDQNDALQDERDALATKYAALVRLVEALPKIEGKIELYSVKAGDCAVIVKQSGLLLATFNSKKEAAAYLALLAYRQGLAPRPSREQELEAQLATLQAEHAELVKWVNERQSDPNPWPLL